MVVVCANIMAKPEWDSKNPGVEPGKSITMYPLWHSTDSFHDHIPLQSNFRLPICRISSCITTVTPQSDFARSPRISKRPIFVDIFSYPHRGNTRRMPSENTQRFSSRGWVTTRITWDVSAFELRKYSEPLISQINADENLGWGSDRVHDGVSWLARVKQKQSEDNAF